MIMMWLLRRFRQRRVWQLRCIFIFAAIVLSTRNLWLVEDPWLDFSSSQQTPNDNNQSKDRFAIQPSFRDKNTIVKKTAATPPTTTTTRRNLDYLSSPPPKVKRHDEHEKTVIQQQQHKIQQWKIQQQEEGQEKLPSFTADKEVKKQPEDQDEVSANVLNITTSTIATEAKNLDHNNTSVLDQHIKNKKKSLIEDDKILTETMNTIVAGSIAAGNTRDNQSTTTTPGAYKIPNKLLLNSTASHTKNTPNKHFDNTMNKTTLLSNHVENDDDNSSNNNIQVPLTTTATNINQNYNFKNNSMLPAMLGNITKSMLAYPLDTWKPQKITMAVGYNNLSSSNIDMNYYSNNYWTGSSSSSQQQQQKQQRLLQIYVYETIQPPELNHVHSCGIKEILNLESPSQYNFFSDLALLNLFLTYPGRTYDPKKADIFVVPYPHSTHCMLTDCRPQYNATHGVHCSQISGETIKQLLKSLKHKTSGQGTWERHLFLLSADSGLLKPMLEKMPLILTLGYRQDFPNDKRYNPRKLTSGQIIVPYLNDHPSFQPSIIYSRNDDAWWTTRPRKYSFVYIYGGSNKKTRGDVETDTRRYRRHFADSVSRRRRSSNSTSNVTSLLIGGLPYILEELPSSSNNKNNATSHSGDRRSRRSPEQIYELYQESILCPCLPGDSPIQKRFFDAIINGCLPVVLKFPPTRRGSLHNETFWHPWQVDIRRVYPYSAPPAPHSPVNKTATIAKQGRRAMEKDAVTEVVGNNKSNNNNNNNNTAILIDYESFVIQVDVPVNDGTIETAMEAILSNPTELRRRQLLMKKYAPLFTYGMGPNAHRYEDAFAQILKLLQSHVDRL